MRDIKFKGKAIMTTTDLDGKGIEHTNGWVKGNLIISGSNCFIVGGFVEVNDEYTNLSWWVKVHEYSVGQFSEELDSYGEEIYEGDCVEYIERNLDQAFGFSENSKPYNTRRLTIKKVGTDLNVPKGFIKEIKVIGNKYEDKGVTNL